MNNASLGLLIARIFVGLRLIYGVADNVLSWNHMLLFRDFLAAHNFPLPLVCAVLSVFVQLIGGAMILVGWKIRYAAVAVAVDFLVALIAVHRNHSVEAMTPALALLVFCVMFFFTGAGRYSIGNNSRQ